MRSDKHLNQSHEGKSVLLREQTAFHQGICSQMQLDPHLHE
jgi:hypothetical protein